MPPERDFITQADFDNLKPLPKLGKVNVNKGPFGKAVCPGIRNMTAMRKLMLTKAKKP